MLFLGAVIGAFAFLNRGMSNLGLLEELKTRMLTADGAMGTLLYSYGIDYCNEELNLQKPEIIEKIHQDYITAGADIIQTNTYGANAIKLERYGLENQIKEINEAAIQIAKRAAAPGGQFVLGTIGGIRGFERAMQRLRILSEWSISKRIICLLEIQTGYY